MSKQVFISYRRDGGDALAHLLYDRLVTDGYDVFLDVESLRSGKFNEEIYDKISECVDFIVILPEHGLDRCIFNEDWVRLEIECALRLKKNIIPVMMRNFTFPNELPETLKDLPNYNGVVAAMDFFDGVINKLEDQLLLATPKNTLQIHRKKTKQNVQKRTDMYMKYFIWILGVLVTIVAGFFFVSKYSHVTKYKLVSTSDWSKRISSSFGVSVDGKTYPYSEEIPNLWSFNIMEDSTLHVMISRDNTEHRSDLLIALLDENQAIMKESIMASNDDFEYFHWNVKKGYQYIYFEFLNSDHSNESVIIEFQFDGVEGYNPLG